MISREELEKMAQEASKIVQEMGQKLAKYDAKTTALLLNDLQVDLTRPVQFPEDYSNKKLDADAANKKLEEFMAVVNNPEKYPLESRVEEAAQMKAIIAEHQQQIKELYDKVLG